MLNENLSISIVDDDESVRRALRRLLLSVGYVVKTYPSAQEFLDCGEYCKNPKNLLILDVQMPGMDGFELQKHLQAAGIGIPIIFITAHENPKAFETAMDAGAVAFLQKPFDDQTLLNAVNLIASTPGLGPIR